MKETICALDDNPFPPSVEIDFEKDFKSIDILRQFSKDLSKENVLYVDDGGKWVTN
ncbi:MAG: hypothetical protein R2877_06310 [Bdellovibrionota bacterium]